MSDNGLKKYASEQYVEDAVGVLNSKLEEMLLSNRWVPIASEVVVYPANEDFPVSFTGDVLLQSDSEGTTTFCSDDYIDCKDIQNLTVSYINGGTSAGTKKVTVDLLNSAGEIIATNSTSGTSTGAFSVVVDTTNISEFAKINVILNITKGNGSNTKITLNKISYFTL